MADPAFGCALIPSGPCLGGPAKRGEQAMLSAWDYLLRLSILAVTFVGWSAIVVTLRRALGGELSDHHRHIVRLLIETGLAVAALGLLPGVLSFTGLADAMIWRLCSALGAFTASALLIRTSRRRRRVASGPTPWYVAANFAVMTAATLPLWVNTVGFHFQPSAAPYVLVLTLYLLLGWLVFVQNLELFFGGTPSR